MTKKKINSRPAKGTFPGSHGWRAFALTLGFGWLTLGQPGCGEDKKNDGACPAPLVTCEDSCVDLRTDPRYCSDTDLCGTGCEDNAWCDDGVCRPACACVVDGLCLGEGQRNPANACLACISDVAADAWSPTDGDPCDDGLFCTTGDACVEEVCTGGAARVCDDGVSCNGAETCDEASTSCLAGVVTCEAPELCDPAADTCVLTCTGCVIDGLCLGEGQRNPDNACLACLPDVAADAWSPTDGDACDDGLYCTTGDACIDDVCTGGAARVCEDGISCNGVETCDEASSSCLPGVPTCPDGMLCHAADDTCYWFCDGCMYEGACWEGWDPSCVPVCPIDLQTLRDDFAVLETTYLGPSTCENHSMVGNLQYSFYRPGCSSSMCGGWGISVNEVYDWMTNPPTFLGHWMTTHDSFDGAPPPSRTFELPFYAYEPCRQVLIAFALERGCP
ncbi:hypothetical protein KJ975_00115 [Myxococcota bacterium]|nr:hypothetical protein [Myxococcota bacterium]